MRSGHHWPQRGRGPCRPEGCHSPQVWPGEGYKPSRTATLGPYRHTTATPHAAVRISMRYRMFRQIPLFLSATP